MTEASGDQTTASAADVAAAYRTINAADPNVATQLKRLRKLYKQVGEQEEVGERAISEMLEGGPGAADRLKGTADAVAALWNIDEEAS